MPKTNTCAAASDWHRADMRVPAGICIGNAQQCNLQSQVCEPEHSKSAMMIFSEPAPPTAMSNEVVFDPSNCGAAVITSSQEQSMLVEAMIVAHEPLVFAAPLVGPFAKQEA
jgi:hypothetical protein